MRPIIMLGTSLAILVTVASRESVAAQQSPIPGFACMSLNISDAQAHDFNFHVPFYASPDPTSPTIGIASASVAVRSPLHEVGAYAEAMMLSGKTGWIAARFLKPHFSPLDPSAKCIPVVLATGRLGFAYLH